MLLFNFQLRESKGMTTIKFRPHAGEVKSITGSSLKVHYPVCSNEYACTGWRCRSLGCDISSLSQHITWNQSKEVSCASVLVLSWSGDKLPSFGPE